MTVIVVVDFYTISAAAKNYHIQLNYSDPILYQMYVSNYSRIHQLIY